jgi:hypothetical protein
MLSLVVKTIPVGVAYAVWAGLRHRAGRIAALSTSSVIHPPCSVWADRCRRGGDTGVLAKLSAIEPKQARETSWPYYSPVFPVRHMHGTGIKHRCLIVYRWLWLNARLCQGFATVLFRPPLAAGRARHPRASSMAWRWHALHRVALTEASEISPRFTALA